MPVYVWNDVSPEDGGSLVRFSMLAESLTEVAQAVRAASRGAQSTTASQLLRNGQARKAAAGEQDPAESNRGIVFWRKDDEQWRPVV